MPPALAAATDGDTLRVRAGRYSPSITSKGVALLGEANAIVGSFLAAASALEVSQLPAGRSFVAKGVKFEGGSPCVQLRNCRGTVHLEGIEVGVASAPSDLITPSPGLGVVGCSAVTLLNCSLVGGPALDCESSVVCATGSLFQGTPDIYYYASFSAPYQSRPAVATRRGTLLLSQSSATGGHGIRVSVTGFPTPYFIPASPKPPGPPVHIGGIKKKR